MQDLLQRGTKYTALPAKFAFLSAVQFNCPDILPYLDCSDNTIIFAALSVICLPKKYFKHINLLHQFSSKMF